MYNPPLLSHFQRWSSSEYLNLYVIVLFFFSVINIIIIYLWERSLCAASLAYWYHILFPVYNPIRVLNCINEKKKRALF